MSDPSQPETIGQKQRRFSLMLAKLIAYAYHLGYEISMGDVWAKTGHRGGSMHYIRLAADLNLFKDSVYLSGEAAASGHNMLHNYWDTIGGSDRIPGDLNHYSIEHNGVR